MAVNAGGNARPPKQGVSLKTLYNKLNRWPPTSSKPGAWRHSPPALRACCPTPARPGGTVAHVSRRRADRQRTAGNEVLSLQSGIRAAGNARRSGVAERLSGSSKTASLRENRTASSDSCNRPIS